MENEKTNQKKEASRARKFSGQYSNCCGFIDDAYKSVQQE